MISSRAVAGLSFLLLYCPTSLFSQSTPKSAELRTTGEQAPAIRTTASLVLVDVLVVQKKTGDPITDLQKEDFLVRDNGKPVSITTFNRGRDQNLRPVQLWFVLTCNEELNFDAIAPLGRRFERTESWGSSFLSGRTLELLPALEHLRAAETVGVAHWCDDGQSEIDRPASLDREKALKVMNDIAARKPVVIQHFGGQDARDQVVSLINRVAQATFPAPFLSFIFVGGKESGASAQSAGAAWSGSMEFSSLELGLTGRDDSSDSSGNLRYAIQSSDYVSRLATFIDALHARYEIGFAPEKHGKKLHHVDVTLTRDAEERYPDAALRYREIYGDSVQGNKAEAALEQKVWRQLDSRLQSAVRSKSIQGGLSFELQRSEGTQEGLERFALKIAPGGLTWKELPNGDRRSIVTAVVAGYSPKGQVITLLVKELEITQESARLPELKDNPVVLSLGATVVKPVARIRVVLRDVASGRIGSQDMQLTEEIHGDRPE
jgi:hypothetical protein